MKKLLLLATLITLTATSQLQAFDAKNNYGDIVYTKRTNFHIIMQYGNGIIVKEPIAGSSSIKETILPDGSRQEEDCEGYGYTDSFDPRGMLTHRAINTESHYEDTSENNDDGCCSKLYAMSKSLVSWLINTQAA